jgi:predicted DNA-binding ribbon-helix-helix protein
MSDPIEEALRHGCTGVMHHPPDRRCVEALEALAVLRGRLAEAQLTVAELVEEAKDAEAENVSLKEALRGVVASWNLEEAKQFARAALASSEGDTPSADMAISPQDAITGS